MADPMIDDGRHMTDLFITEQDVNSFRGKLDAWGATLADGERAILQLVVVRAFPEAGAESASEVEGFDKGTTNPTGKVKVRDISITKYVDSASPVFFTRQTFLPHGTVEAFVGVSFSVKEG